MGENVTRKCNKMKKWIVVQGGLWPSTTAHSVYAESSSATMSLCEISSPHKKDLIYKCKLELKTDSHLINTHGHCMYTTIYEFKFKFKYGVIIKKYHSFICYGIYALRHTRMVMKKWLNWRKREFWFQLVSIGWWLQPALVLSGLPAAADCGTEHIHHVH